MLGIYGILATLVNVKDVDAQTWTPNNYWTFDGSNSLSDSMSRSNLNPSYFGSTYTVSAAQGGIGTGKFMTFNGSEKLIVASNPLALDTGFTIELLVRFGQNSHETMEIFGRRDAAISIRFGFPFIRFGTRSIPNGGSSLITDTYEIELKGIGRGTYGYYTDNNWHHLVFKYDAKAGVKEVWVDGQLPIGFSKTLPAGRIPTNATNSNDNVCDLNTTTTYYSFIGDIDELATYTFPLPGAMIFKHYNESLQHQHFSFSNSTTPPPAPSSIVGSIDITEYAPGHPNANVDAVTQLQTFPSSRFKPGNTLFPNIQVFNPAHIAGWLTSNYTNTQLINRSKDVQKELVTNFNYAFQLSNNSGSVSAFSDTNTFPGAWIKYANQNTSWRTSVNSYWPQLIPKDAGKTSKEPYMSCSCQPNSSYLKNAAGQFLDQWGNVVTSYKVISPEAPTDSIKLDGQTQRYYLDQLTKKLTRPLDVIFENGEATPRWEQAALTSDPTVLAAFNASGLNNWHKYMGRAMNRFSSAYVNEFKTLPSLANTRFIYYQINGNPQYSWDYAETRTLETQINSQYYSSGDIYMKWAWNWRYWSADAHGWQFLIDSRLPELTIGDKLYGPTVCPGWDNNEESNVRPAQWLGFLKAVAMTGAEYFNTGYFVEQLPYQNPMNYVWEMAMPGYAQGITSRYEDLLKNGYIMGGDMPNNIITNTTQPGYSFYAGDVRKLVVVRKSNTIAKYAITGTIQPNSNVQGNADLNSTATINLDGQKLTFNIRRQGSTYIYDNSNTSLPVFYQLDAWHEASHPYFWDKSFKLEAELFDNVNASVEIKTEVPAGTKVGDFTNYTSYIGFKSPSTAEYNFTPRGTTTSNYYVWVRARSKDGSNTGFNLQLDGTINHSVACVIGTTWTWYCFNTSNSLPIAYSNLSLQNHKLAVTATTAMLEIDQITVTPQSGNYYSVFAAACNATTPPTATITAAGPITFCQGNNVILSANTGTVYLWSNGATTQNITISTAGNYTVAVTSANGTAISSPTAVVVNTIPTNTITTSGPTTFCQGGNVTLTSSSTSGTYLWSNGVTAASINTSTSGNYNVTVTSANGCSSTSAITYVIASSTVPSIITASGATTFCQGGNVNLTANTGIAYKWSTGATTSSINVTTTGNYSVSVTQSGGCSTTSSAIAITASNSIPATISASGPATFCSGGLVTITASSGSSYKWSNGATTPSIALSSSGTYNVTVTQLGGCSSTSSAYVVSVLPLPTNAVTTSGALTFCQGGSVNLTASASLSTYKWSTGATTASINASSSGSYLVTVTGSNGCSSVSSSYVVSSTPSVPSTITAGGPTTFCIGGNVTLTANAGSAFLWSTGATTASISVSTSGNYAVSVTQSSGCSSSSSPLSITASNAAPATVTASGTTTFCQGGAVTLFASSGSNYLWSNGATTSSISLSNSGTYNVTITQAGGCSSVSSQTSVVVNAIPSQTVNTSGPTTFCQGNSVTLFATATSSTFKWSTGATTASIIANTSGNYNVTITGANGCSIQSIVIPVTASSNVPATITTSGSTTFCVGGNVTLTANSGTAYLWSNGSTSSSINVTTTGSYTVRVSQLGGCSATSVATTVTSSSSAPATITASGPIVFCQGSSVTLTANTGSSYLWSTGATTASITTVSSGNFSVTVNQLGGCNGVSPITNVNAITNIPASIIANGPLTFCGGGSVILNANSGSAYLWSNGATTSSITVNTTGSYLVTVSQNGGCTSIAPSVSVNASSGSSTPATVSPSGSVSICQGGNTTFTASTGSIYLWSTGATTASIIATSSGNYSVTVTQSGGCSAVSTPSTLLVNPIASFTMGVSGPLSFCSGGNVVFSIVSSTPNIGYVWYKNNVVMSGVSTSSYTASTAGTYLARVQLGGCGAFSNRYSVTIPCREGEIINKSDFNFTAYPNPFVDGTTLAFELTDPTEVTVRILDMSGKLIDILLNKINVNAGETKIEYATSNLANGIYIAEIITSTSTQRIKIMSSK